LALCFLVRPAAAADVPITEEARRHFNAGVAYLQDPDGARYAAAYPEFIAAYKLSPSWKMLGNLGIAAMKLERDGEAVEAFTNYLKEGGDELDASEREQITRDLNTLKASLATISVESAPAGATLIDERIPVTGSPIVNRYGPLDRAIEVGVKGGRHRITAQLDGHEPELWEVDAQPGSSQSHQFKLKLTPPPSKLVSGGASGGGPPLADDRGSPGLRVASYAAFGVGVVGLAGGTFFALSAKSKTDDAADLCGGNLAACSLDAGSPDAERVTKLNNDSGSAKTLGIVGFGLGGVGIAAGITLFVLSSGGGSSAASARPARIMPWFGFNSAGVTGKF